MASGVHSDKRSRVGDSPRFQWESVSRCCAELYVPRPKTRLRSGLARKHLSVSRQTSRAPVSAPIDGMLSYVHSGCPKLNRSLRGETRAVRSSGEIPGSPRRSCGAPPVPPRARSGEQTPPAAERYHCAYSGLGVAQLVGPNCVRLGDFIRESRPKLSSVRAKFSIREMRSTGPRWNPYGRWTLLTRCLASRTSPAHSHRPAPTWKIRSASRSLSMADC